MKKAIKYLRVTIMLSMLIWFTYTAVTFARNDEILLNWCMYLFRGAIAGFVSLVLIALLMISFNGLVFSIRTLIGTKAKEK